MRVIRFQQSMLPIVQNKSRKRYVSDIIALVVHYEIQFSSALGNFPAQQAWGL